MNDIVSAASILAGAGGGGWLADKLLSPSMDALGQQIRAYAGKRLADIFGIAQRKAANLSAVESLPPGYALNFIQKASFSEDDALLTEMWGGLLASSASRVQPRHNLYVEIYMSRFCRRSVHQRRLRSMQFFQYPHVAFWLMN